jgi:tetratricopeptide (TPR) repeat protein
MRRARIRPPLRVVLALVLSAGTALAGGTAAADALFREALAAAQSGNYAKAVEKFKASYELEPSPGALQGMALAEEKLGKLAAAHAHYRELVERSKAKQDKKRLKLAQERIAAIEPKLAKLTLTAAASPPDGATLELDGTEFPLAALGSELPTDPGAHVIKGSAPDGASFEKKFTLSEGQKQFVTVAWQAAATSAAAKDPGEPPPTLPKETAPSDEPKGHKSSLGTVGLIVAGAGVVITGAGAYFYLQSNKTFNDVNDRCPSGRCDPALQTDVDRGKRDETLGRIGLGLGGAAVVTGVVLFVIGNGQAKEQSSARVVPYVGSRSLGLSGRF